MEEERNEQESEEEEEPELLHHRDALLAHLLQFFPARQNNGTNEQLVALLKRARHFTSAKVEEAMLAIPRQYFVTEDLLPDAYSDNPLRFSRMGFNISAPHMHAMCLENMDIQPGNIVLDIGSGSGLLTAYAAYLTGPTGHVYGLDLHDHIIEFSEKNMEKLAEAKNLEFSNITFIKRNCFLPAAKPILYDRIHVGCCCPETKLQFLYDILKPGGIVVVRTNSGALQDSATIATPYGDQLIKAVKDTSGNIDVTTLVGVRYSDLTLPSDAEIRAAEREIQIARASNIVVLNETIEENFGALLCSTHLSDMILVVGGDRIPAHSLLLSMYSPHFQNLISESQQMEGDKKIVVVDQVGSQVFKELLQFMYTGRWKEGLDHHLLLEAKDLAVKLGIFQPEEDTSCLLIKHLNSLVGSPKFSDILFQVDGHQIPGHKLILRIRSDYFNSMLGGGLRESRNSTIDIQDCTAEIFTEVLRFIYTGECDINEDNCIGILEQANLLRLDRLTTMCEQFWFKNINSENAAAIMQVSDHYNAHQLKQFALQYIFEHVKEVVATTAWKELDIELISMVLVAAVERGK